MQFIQAQLDGGRTVHGHEVDAVARQVITDAGYGDYFIHRTGHSLGPTGHYLGVNIDNLETQDRRVLLPGVMFTIEPGIYMPAFNFDSSAHPKGLGIRSEINCFMHPDRCRSDDIADTTRGARPVGLMAGSGAFAYPFLSSSGAVDRCSAWSDEGRGHNV